MPSRSFIPTTIMPRSQPWPMLAGSSFAMASGSPMTRISTSPATEHPSAEAVVRDHLPRLGGECLGGHEAAPWRDPDRVVLARTCREVGPDRLHDSRLMDITGDRSTEPPDGRHLHRSRYGGPD